MQIAAAAAVAATTTVASAAAASGCSITNRPAAVFDGFLLALSHTNRRSNKPREQRRPCIKQRQEMCWHCLSKFEGWRHRKYRLYHSLRGKRKPLPVAAAVADAAVAAADNLYGNPNLCTPARGAAFDIADAAANAAAYAANTAAAAVGLFAVACASLFA